MMRNEDCVSERTCVIYGIAHYQFMKINDMSNHKDEITKSPVESFIGMLEYHSAQYRLQWIMMINHEKMQTRIISLQSS